MVAREEITHDTINVKKKIKKMLTCISLAVWNNSGWLQYKGQINLS